MSVSILSVVLHFNWRYQLFQLKNRNIFSLFSMFNWFQVLSSLLQVDLLYYSFFQLSLCQNILNSVMVLTMLFLCILGKLITGSNIFFSLPCQIFIFAVGLNNMLGPVYGILAAFKVGHYYNIPNFGWVNDLLNTVCNTSVYAVKIMPQRSDLCFFRLSR